MKYVVKIFGILFTGLFVATVLYPFLHEFGHAAATVLSGANLCEFRLFPQPYVVCNLSRLSFWGQCIIGISGMLLPFLLSCLVRSKRFWLWIVCFFLKSISIFAFGISYVAVLCYESGIIFKNEDIVKVVQISGSNSFLWLIMMLSLICLAVVSLYFDKPLERLKRYFNI